MAQLHVMVTTTYSRQVCQPYGANCLGREILISTPSGQVRNISGGQVHIGLASQGSKPLVPELTIFNTLCGGGVFLLIQGTLLLLEMVTTSWYGDKLYSGDNNR
jgi:hypothetical protein